MTPMASELAAGVRRITLESERFFRLALFQADDPADRERAKLGLRHAVGLRKAVDQLPVAPGRARSS